LTLFVSDIDRSMAPSSPNQTDGPASTTIARDDGGALEL
jgi:hypothetical protein